MRSGKIHSACSDICVHVTMIDKESIHFTKIVYVYKCTTQRNAYPTFERGTIIGERESERLRKKERDYQTRGGESQAMSPLWHASRRRACK